MTPSNGSGGRAGGSGNSGARKAGKGSSASKGSGKGFGSGKGAPSGKGRPSSGRAAPRQGVASPSGSRGTQGRREAPGAGAGEREGRSLRDKGASASTGRSGIRRAPGRAGDGNGDGRRSERSMPGLGLGAGNLLTIPPGWVLLEGRRPVLEALRAGRRLSRIVVASGASARGALAEVLERAATRQVPVERLSRSVLEAAGSELTQGVVAVAAPLEPGTLDDVLVASRRRGEPAFLLALDGVQDPRNLGAIARSAEAAGCHGLIVTRFGSAPLSVTAEKASAGALGLIPVAEVPSLAKAIEQMQEAGIWCVAMDGGADQSLFDLSLSDQPVCLVVGGEGEGVQRLVRERCELVVSVPLHGTVESLNVSVAAGLGLYEVRRRRGGPPISAVGR